MFIIYILACMMTEIGLPPIMVMFELGLLLNSYNEWRDIDFDNGLIYVQSKPEFRFHTKSYIPRSIPMCKELQTLPIDMLQAGRFVFDNSHDQLLYHPNAYYKEIVKIYKRAGIKGANLHTLRHTFVSHRIMKGVDPRTVQEYLGHSSIQITEKYSHLSKSYKRDAINVLSFRRQVEIKLKQIGEAKR